ncbi:MAG: efflux transporter periplasmic adaptor subunit [Massilia sp.]|nr:efflux transporter periplasmic adaptor subunit [Massilia sp.]
MYPRQTLHHRSGRAAGLFVTGIALGLAGCRQEKPAASPPAAPEVTVAAIHATSVPLSVELPGRTNAFLVAQVRSRVDGLVKERSFVEGADVKAGQVLYQIDPAPYRATLANAQAQQQKAAANLAASTASADRYRSLVGGTAVSKQAVDNAIAAEGQAAAELAAAKAGVETARINLGYTRVVAPISGRSSVSQVTQGAYVQASGATLLTTIQQIDPMYVDLSQSSVAGLQLRREIASGQVHAGGAMQSDVRLTLEDGSTYPLVGKLQFSGVTVDPATGSVTVRATFPNPQHVLLPGMFVHASISQGVAANAMLVPAGAVSHNPQGQATAMVVGNDNKVEVRVLETKTTAGANWIVTRGLADGERVIVAGVQLAKPGMVVKPVVAVAAPAAAGANIAAAAPAGH